VIPGSCDISFLSLEYSVCRKYNNPPTSSIFSKRGAREIPPEKKNLVDSVETTRNVFQTNFQIPTNSFADMCRTLESLVRWPSTSFCPDPDVWVPVNIPEVWTARYRRLRRLEEVSCFLLPRVYYNFAGRGVLGCRSSVSREPLAVSPPTGCSG
jgi:hypothetical protein